MSIFQVLASKDPNNVIAYQSDFSAFFVDIGDTLDHSVVEVVDASGAPVASDMLILSVQSTAKGIVTYWLSGGTAGTDYRVRTTVFGARTTPAQISESSTVVIPCRQG